jgi:mono/diheme cytochrome c family protein
MHKIALFALTILGTAHAQTVDFSRDIQPIFANSCYGCHGAKMQMGGLRLDSKKLAFAGGQSGKSIQPSKSAESILYQRVAGIGEQARMPMGGKPLESGQIAAIRNWIDQGANWPDDAGAEITETKKHWAYIPPQRPAS